MTEPESPTISFSKKVDQKGRLIIPKEHRQALTIEGREALVEFEATKITYLDEDDGGDA
jgi:bifunctional DNA-binding transcriptional regulator/antitoxin component of YhaV-PrlF toxin-antitoxin module